MSPVSKLARPDRARRILRLFILGSLDLTAFVLSTFLAFELRFDGALPAQYFRSMEMALFIWAAAKCASFIVCSVDQRSWRYTSVFDAVRIASAISAGSLIGGLAIFLLVGPSGIPRSVYILDWLSSCLLILGGRLTVRLILAALCRGSVAGERTRTLIYGAGGAGLALLQELQQNQSLMCDVIGFVDDDSSKFGLTLHGGGVLGTGDALGALAQKHAIKRVLIAIPSATGPQMVRILKLATDAKV